MRSPSRPRLLLALCLTAGLAMATLTACDAAPGPDTPSGPPPVLSDFAFSPEAVVFEDLPPEAVVNDTLAQIPMTLSVRAVDADLDSVLYVIKAPFDAVRVFKAGHLTAAGGGRYAASFVLSAPIGGTGLYDIVVYAVDEERQLSNRMRGLMPFRVLGGGPPEITEIVAPDTFRPPGDLTLVAVVTDPDGLSNIRRVVVRTPSGSELRMFDDGTTQGDAAAGDGRYTARFNVPNATPGTQTFGFQAFDRSGLASAVVTRDVTVVN